jgi:uncharacterized membrane protein
VLGWTFYDLLCRSPLGKREGLFGIIMFVFIVAMAFVLSKLLSGRAAYIHIGAMIGTMMVGNVLMLIIPGQRKLVEAMQQGKSPDPLHGQKAKQRSVHNNYFTLPVLFIMISNHYAMTYSHSYNWLVLAGIIAPGVLIRHFFNLRHKGITNWAYPAAGVALLIVVAISIAPKPAVKHVQTAGAISTVAQFTQVQGIINQRCVACHSAQPTQPGFAAAPAGIMLHSHELIRQNAARVYQRSVVLKDMPLANLTHITNDERATIAAWYEAGAK